mmetsp:Transcript_24231/g.84139  ORF Transcript_24231/g.84139 Transcript_24231/m.84139 type:complete len:308 (+) Transcript_24231:2155-3078(+)
MAVVRGGGRRLRRRRPARPRHASHIHRQLLLVRRRLRDHQHVLAVAAAGCDVHDGACDAAVSSGGAGGCVGDALLQAPPRAVREGAGDAAGMGGERGPPQGGGVLPRGEAAAARARDARGAVGGSAAQGRASVARGSDLLRRGQGGHRRARARPRSVAGRRRLLLLAAARALRAAGAVVVWPRCEGRGRGRNVPAGGSDDVGVSRRSCRLHHATRQAGGVGAAQQRGRGGRGRPGRDDACAARRGEAGVPVPDAAGGDGHGRALPHGAARHLHCSDLRLGQRLRLRGAVHVLGHARCGAAELLRGAA